MIQHGKIKKLFFAVPAAMLLLSVTASGAAGYADLQYDAPIPTRDCIGYVCADGENAAAAPDVGEEIKSGITYLVSNSVTGRYSGICRVVAGNAENGTVVTELDSFTSTMPVGGPVEYYGRNALSALPNKDALLYAYDRIVNGIENSAEEINIYNGTDAITVDETHTVFDAYLRDHTEHFWIGNTYGMELNDETALRIKPSYIMSGTALEKAKDEFNAAAAELLNGITGEMSEYEREKILHDRLAAKITYDVTGANAHNPYGAIVEGKAVCEGYAEAFQYLLQRVGIQSFIIVGSSANPSGGAVENHAWNAVRIDGKFYHVDTTWDDQDEHIFYAYFNKTTEAIKEDHIIDVPAYALPVCNSEDADFFSVNGGKLPTFDIDSVAELIKNGSGRIYVTGDKEAFAAECLLESNVSALIAKLGYTRMVQYGYVNLGREFILTLKQEGVAVSGTVTSYKSETDDVKIELFREGESTAAYTQTVYGKNAGYTVADVDAGTYIMKVSKNKHVTREYTVTVGDDDPVTQNAEIWMLGDVNGDGFINMTDASQIKRKFNGKTSVFDTGDAEIKAYRLKVANVYSADGIINTTDAAQIKRHYNGKASVLG